MERMTTVARLALASVLAIQIWTLYRVEQMQVANTGATMPSDAAETLSANGDEQYPPLSENRSQDVLLHALKRIDARLAVLEKSSINKNAVANPTKTNYEPSASERQSADQRLNSLLPSGPLTREEYTRLNADIQALPADERVAVATALSRAINEGRVQPLPGAM